MNIFVLTGASGSGKTTFVNILKEFGVWEECISHTTRQMRNGETDGETYYFIDNEKFEEMNSNGEFIEKVVYDGNKYGVSQKEIDRVLSNGRDVVIIAEYNGYKQIKEKMPEAIGIFINTDMYQCFKNMKSRGDDTDKAMQRIYRYDEDVKNKGEFDYVIKNIEGNLNITANILLNIVYANRKFNL